MRLGYACINTTLRERGIFNSRSCTMNTLVKMGPDKGVLYLKKLVMENIADLQRILEWNEQHGIRLFRLTSSIFSNCGNFLLPAEFRRTSYIQGDIRFAESALRAVGDYARRMGHRLTFHQNPFVQLGSPNREVLNRSIFDIMIYGKVLRALGPVDGCIVMHVGGIYQKQDTRDGAKRKTLDRWLSEYKKLPGDIRKWIVLENDESYYGVNDVLPFCERNSIPFCLDVFHNSISAEHVPVTPALLRRVLATWPRGMTPKFHLSEQEPKARFGAHSAYVKKFPEYFIKMHNIDIMIEAKMKEQAVLRLYKKYFTPESKGARLEWRIKSV